MKLLNRILLLLVLFVSYQIYSEEMLLKLDDSKKYTYSEVVELQSAKKNELYNTFKERYVPSLRDASQLIYSSNIKKGGIELENKEEGRIIISHSFDIEKLPYGCLIYTLEIEFKDNKYRFSIYDLTISYGGAVVEPFEVYIAKQSKMIGKKVLETCDSNFKTIINNLKDKMKTSIKKDSNW